jgi:hypothetical protein
MLEVPHIVTTGQLHNNMLEVTHIVTTGQLHNTDTYHRNTVSGIRMCPGNDITIIQFMDTHARTTVQGQSQNQHEHTNV